MGKRELLANALERTGLGSVLSRTLGRWSGLVVFNYHRIGEAAASPFDRALYSANAEQFAQQVRFLKKHYDVVRIEDLQQTLHRPGRAVLITFDDGYRDNFEFAYPILKEQSAPATFFITSGFIDGGPVAWWDEIAWMVHTCRRSELPSMALHPKVAVLHSPEQRELAIRSLLRAYKSLPEEKTRPFLTELASASASGRCPGQMARDTWMSWEMIRELDRNGMDIGGHTVTHPVLSQADPDRQRQEIQQSKFRIETELGHPVTAFSYPVGQKDSFTATTKTLLKEAGYRWAFSFSGGFSTTGRVDEFDVPRVAVSPHISRELFRSTARLPRLFA